MKRVLVATDNLSDQVNGVVTTFNNISKYGAKEKFDIHYIDPSNFKNFSMPKYNEVKIAAPQYFKLKKLIREIDPNYIHIATEGMVGLMVKVYCDIHRISYTTSYHTKFPEYLNELYNIPFKVTYSYLKWFHKNSKTCLVTTKSMYDELTKQGFTNPMVVWTRGIRDELVASKRDRTQSDKTKVLYVGRVSKEKSIEDLLELSHHYNITIVGDGPQKKNLEKKYKDVKFVGYKHGEELANYYADADVFCFPSKTDTFGIVMIEALSFGVPVAAYPVTGPVDIISSGLNGYLSNDLNHAIQNCVELDRSKVFASSKQYSFENCWKIFRDNLVGINFEK